jgi:hypothetical protein
MNRVEKLDTDLRAELKAIYAMHPKGIGKVRARLIEEVGIGIESINKWERGVPLSYRLLCKLNDWIDSNR